MKSGNAAVKKGLTMKLSQKIRKIWYDAFYTNASKERVEFALRCQDVTSNIDLHEKPTTLSGHFRFWLHLSLCQSCRNYYELSKALGKAIKRNPEAESTGKVEQINKVLLEKYGRKENSK